MDGYLPYSRGEMGGMGIVKFKCKGSFLSGVSLGEAQSDILLPGQDDSYTLEHLNVDHRGKILSTSECVDCMALLTIANV